MMKQIKKGFAKKYAISYLTDFNVGNKSFALVAQILYFSQMFKLCRLLHLQLTPSET